MAPAKVDGVLELRQTVPSDVNEFLCAIDWPIPTSGPIRQPARLSEFLQVCLKVLDQEGFQWKSIFGRLSHHYHHPIILVQMWDQRAGMFEAQITSISETTHSGLLHRSANEH